MGGYGEVDGSGLLRADSKGVDARRWVCEGQ